MFLFLARQVSFSPDFVAFCTVDVFLVFLGIWGLDKGSLLEQILNFPQINHNPGTFKSVFGCLYSVHF